MRHSHFFVTRYHGIEVRDFGPSWRDGVAFQSVVHAIRPDLVDMEVVRRRSNRENLEDAFALAENELGIPRLLDPEGDFRLCSMAGFFFFFKGMNYDLFKKGS